MSTANLREICSFLDTTLNTKAFKDASLNGLQIESSSSAIKKVGFSVDAGYSVAEKAVKAGCQLLVVHHGLLWGECAPIVGPWARKLSLFLENGLSLYANHLPLDGHQELGNAAQLASLLKLAELSPCFQYGGATIGIRGRLAQPASMTSISAMLSGIEGILTPPLTLPFGKPDVRTVGIATGSGTMVIPECAELGIDLLITGEAKQSAYHEAMERGVSVLCIGHYASETFGVRALERVLSERFRVETAWISEPTGI